jgi:hypothetical protein
MVYVEEIGVLEINCLASILHEKSKGVDQSKINLPEDLGLHKFVCNMKWLVMHRGIAFLATDCFVWTNGQIFRDVRNSFHQQEKEFEQKCSSFP